MGTGLRQLWAANLGFGKWLQRCTERGEPEGRRPRGWGPSLLSFRGVRWQWSRPGTSRFPATGSPGPGLRELRQRAALLGRWLCKIRGHGSGRDSPTIPITFGSSRTQIGGADCNPDSVRAYCVRGEEENLALRRPRAGG